MDGTKDDFPTQSQGFSKESNTVVVASIISQGTDTSLNKQRKRMQELRERKAKLQETYEDNVAARNSLTSILRGKLNRISEYNECSLENKAKLLKESKESDKKQLLKEKDLCNTLLDSFESDAFQVAELFCSGPKLFALDKINEDIRQEDLQVDEVETYIRNEIDPKISASKDANKNVPVCVFEIPGSVSQELTADELKMLSSALKKSAASNQAIEELEQKIRALKQEENST